jgi:hypothetical protein
MTNMTYHGVFFCILLAALEWPAISQNKAAAVFCLLAVIFYLFYLSAYFHDNSISPSRINRIVRWNKKKQAKKAGTAMIFCSLLFVINWMPYSQSVQVIFVCCAFFFLVYQLANISFAYLQAKGKKELDFEK